MDMERKREKEENWGRAQSIGFSVDLVSSAQRLRSFLATVDRHPCLYVEHGPALSNAIRRYEECWLPLLASCPDGFTPMAESFGQQLPLRPPLDCEWVWLCHRLNPIIYARDCDIHYGRLLGAPPYLDSPEVTQSTQRFWEKRFPHEPYTLDFAEFADRRIHPAMDIHESKINYDLHAAVARQSTFFYQVSEPHMGDDHFLRAAEQRYKGFLELFRMTDASFFLVPTYDIDLIWHAHQLDPIAYNKDITQILGRVLGHDDSDSDRTPGHKLQQGFAQTCKLWLETYGIIYERAGAMYRGEPPSAIPRSMSLQSMLPEVVGTPLDYTPIASRKLMQVFVAVIAARNIPTSQKGKLTVRLQMQRKASSFQLDTAAAPLSSEVTWNQKWTFGAEISTKGLILVLRLRRSNTIKQILQFRRPRTKVLGKLHLSWKKVLESPSLAFNSWVSLETTNSQKPEPFLFISVSLTPPQPAPQLLRTINSVATDDTGTMQTWVRKQPGRWLTRTVLDHANREVFIIRVRYAGGKSFDYKRISESDKCIYIHQGGWQYNDHTDKGTAPANIVTTALQVVTGLETKEELSMRRCWCFFGNSTQLTVTRSRASTGRILSLLLELDGNLRNQISLECGRKLEYEVKGASEKDEAGFVTLIRYDTADVPFGRATALFNWRTGAMEVSPNESVILVLLLSTIISMSVFDMEDLDVEFKPNPALPNRSTQSSNEWGSVILRGNTSSKSMMPYYCWWGISPIIWVYQFYDYNNVLVGASACLATGACGGGGGGCGGTACGGGGISAGAGAGCKAVCGGGCGAA